MEIEKNEAGFTLRVTRSEFGLLSVCVGHVSSALAEGCFQKELGASSKIVQEIDEVIEQIFQEDFKNWSEFR